MLTTPHGPPGSAGQTASPPREPAPADLDLASTVVRLQHDVALLTARRELEDARAATAALTPAGRSPAKRASPEPAADRAAASGAAPRPAVSAPTGGAPTGTAPTGTAPTDTGPTGTSPAGSGPTSAAHAAHAPTTAGRASSGHAAPSSEPAGTIASWLAHHQLGVAVESIGERVARALGVVPAAEREAMSAAVTEALVTSAREHLDRTTAAELNRAPRSSLEQACMAALDRQARLSIEEARRRNALEDDDSASPEAQTVAETSAPDSPDPPEERALTVLVTDDPLVAASDWQAQLLSTQVSAHQAVLDRLMAQTTAAAEDLQATLDGWAQAMPSGQVTAAHSLGIQVLDLARSDLTVSHRVVSAGSHELVVRGAAALAKNLGQHGRVVADEVTTLAPESSPLITALHDLLQHRAALAESTAALAGVVARARSLAGMNETDAGAAGVAPPESTSPTSPLEGSVADPGETAQPAPITDGRHELARRALLHERAVQHVVEALGSLDRDLTAWTAPGADGAAPPLLTAIARERLHAEGGFSHVLVLQDEGLTADVISRHSVLGDAGRRTHVGAARVSWLLLDVASGAVIEGGQATPARTVVQDVASGRTTSRSMTPQGTAPLPVDTQHSLEVVVKFLAVTAGLAALILSVVALINLLLT